MSITTGFLIVIGLIVFIGFISHIQVSFTLKKWLTEVEQLSQSDSGHMTASQWLHKTLEEYKTFHLSGTPVNTPALIEKHLYKERILIMGVLRTPIGNCSKLLVHLPSFAIVLGIMGTFLGLTLSMFSMQETLTSLGNAGGGQLSFDSIISSITEPFEGMSLAFITSIAGIGAALFLNILQSGFLSKGQSTDYLIDKLFTETESLLDHHFQGQLLNEKPKDSFEKILDRLADKVGESFQNTIGDFSRDMVHFTEKLDTTMNDVMRIIEAQKTHSERFAEATESLTTFGERFKEGTDSFGDSTEGIKSHIQSLEGSVDRVFQRNESQEKRIEQHQKQMQSIIQQSDKKAEELSRQFLRAMDQQLQTYQDKYDTAADSMHRQQEDWLYQHQEMNNHYAQASDGFKTSVEQLERALYQMFEKAKRDITEQMKYQQDRQAQMMNQDQGRQDTRDLLRSVENVSHAVDRQMNDTGRYFQEFYQLLQRISGLMEQQMRDQSRPTSQQGLPTRVID
ncbi:hypothetical protein [Tuberibacillus sp. Marseille-P3662]|uniref:hypothetical protein n=1 Tax=Tuberibacillus sp. Marseille-P3662 TaxID=1965358 RepID=UPI000A1C7E09|nr:hypothetical protein [Tuberibacillus sp. Marseille-P3662]